MRESASSTAAKANTESKAAASEPASEQSDDTVIYLPDENFADKFFAPPSPAWQIEIGAATDVGKVRSNNEDSFAVVRRNRSSELLLSSFPADEVKLADDHAYALIVADGMGGASFGEFASRLALQTALELGNHATSWVMKFTDQQVQQIEQRVAAFVEQILTALRASSLANPELAGMGTTWTSVHLLPPHAMVVHIGDSRAYLFRAGKLTQITHDETMAQALIDSGIAPERVKHFSHVLLNSLGDDKENVTAQIHQLELRPGDRILLSTDGLNDMVSAAEIVNLLQRHPTPQAACDALVRTALLHGGKDNVTVVLANVAS